MFRKDYSEFLAQEDARKKMEQDARGLYPFMVQFKTIIDPELLEPHEIIDWYNKIRAELRVAKSQYLKEFRKPLRNKVKIEILLSVFTEVEQDVIFLRNLMIVKSAIPEEWSKFRRILFKGKMVF